MENEDNRKLFATKVSDGETFFLPMATILETGNHIGQLENGDKRYICATSFVKFVKSALEATSNALLEPPFVTINFLEANILSQWIDSFTESATQGMGFGDVSIVKDWEEQKDKNTGRRVYIWSEDAHLQGYDYRPTI